MRSLEDAWLLMISERMNIIRYNDALDRDLLCGRNRRKKEIGFERLNRKRRELNRDFFF